MASEFKVSVCMVTYNHERYIRQAVESALTQLTTFAYEIVIGEDCSTDNTRAILQELQQQHPGKIRLLLRERNLGAARNFADTYAACHGAFLAMMEGDDFWASPHKLQRQVDALEAHPEWAICCHGSRIVDESGSPYGPDQPAENVKSVSTVDDLTTNFIHTCTVMYRGGLVAELPLWMHDLQLQDWPLHILHARRGSIGYLPEVMAVYRLHAGGAWSQQNFVYRARAITQMLSRLARHSGEEYADQVEAMQLSFAEELARNIEHLTKAAAAVSTIKKTKTFRLGETLLFPAHVVVKWSRKLRRWWLRHVVRKEAVPQLPEHASGSPTLTDR